MACDVLIVHESVNTLWKKLTKLDAFTALEDLERIRYFGRSGFLFCVIDYMTWHNNLGIERTTIQKSVKQKCLAFYGEYIRKQVRGGYVMASKRPQARPLTEYRIVVKRYDNMIERKSKVYLYS